MFRSANACNGLDNLGYRVSAVIFFFVDRCADHSPSRSDFFFSPKKKKTKSSNVERPGNRRIRANAGTRWYSLNETAIVNLDGRRRLI